MHAQDIAEADAEIKAPRAKPTTRDSDLWYERYPRRFREATSKLKFELRGAYSLLIDLYFEHGAPLPNDNKWIACGLYIDVRKWVHIRKALFTAGKLYIGKDGLIHNELADDLLAKRKAMIAAEQRAASIRSRGGENATPASTHGSTPASTPRGTAGDFSKSSNEINGSDIHSNSNSNTNKVGDSGEVENPSSVISLAHAAAARMDLKELAGKLREAGGDVLADPAASPNLLSMSIPLWWIEQGCDLERDILPAIRKIAGRKRKGRRIVAWEYFDALVAENRDARRRDMPAVHSDRTEPAKGGQPLFFGSYDPEVARRYKEQQAELLKRPMVQAPKARDAA